MDLSCNTSELTRLDKFTANSSHALLDINLPTSAFISTFFNGMTADNKYLHGAIAASKSLQLPPFFFDLIIIYI